MTPRSLGDVLNVIEREAAALRGVDGDRVPLLTISDVLELVDLWTDVLGQVLERENLGAGSRLASRWGGLVGDAVTVAGHLAPGDLYPDPSRVWYELRRLSSQVDHEPNPRRRWRNADEPDLEALSGGEPLDQVNIVDLWGAMVRHFKATRGVVEEPNPPAGRPPGHLPKTTVGEVLALIQYWTALVGQVDAKLPAAAADAWQRATSHVLDVVKGMARDEVYPEDWTFWDELGDLAVALNHARAAAHLPSSFDFKASLARAIKALPRRIEAAAESVVHVADEGATAGYHAARDVAGDVAHGLKGLATPLLVGGAVLVGAVLVLPPLLARDRR